ncbi:acetate kinase [Rhodanobacter sp. A1T4]|uniref:acetate/propionate family kinase n=1 Tax=Rhodanobacter sp. A1T4 TaxID=2723087 RepID=UPI001617C017|nr:acetate kinase [Rhodanobacter sp. A1T4]
MKPHREKNGIIICLNVGSSSLKFSIYRSDSGALGEIGSGTVDSDETGPARLSFDYFQGRKPSIKQRSVSGSAVAALRELAASEDQIIAVGHRLVHGGLTIRDHLKLSPDVIAALRRATPFAPLHLPPSLDLIDECLDSFPGIPQVGCLDTTFHKDLPPLAATLPLPKQIRDIGLRRFGFHGLSCESVLKQLEKQPVRRLVVAHLGGGSSVTAITNGHSVDTSMSLTPMGGAIMSHRPGDLDPGILFYLLREKYYDLDALEDLLEHQAGVAGVSQTNGDMRDLQNASDRGDAYAKLALDMFVRSIAKQIAGMCVVLGGIDLLVFTGGVGEHATAVRERIVQMIESSLGSPSQMVLPSQENERIAFHTLNLIES